MADIGKECFTKGCTNKARWIAIAEPSISPDYNKRYRCPECCDLIDNGAAGLKKRYEGKELKQHIKAQLLDVDKRTLRYNSGE